MAEAIALIGVVGSIIQLVDFSSRVLHRLEEFQSSLGEIPRSFRHIKAELPVLQDTLQQTREAIEAGSVKDETKKALIPVIEGCTEQIGLLDPIIAKLSPIATDSRLRRGTKAISSLYQEAKVESITKILRCYVGTLTFYYAAISSTLQPLTDSKLTKIRQWLSPPDPSLNYQKALKRRQADTGLWFLESDEYATWKKNSASFLWLHGIPGCGKTILNCAILQDVLQYCADDPGKVVAYFYFDFNDTQKQSPELMVRSLVSQLSQQCVKIPPILETLFFTCQNGQRQPSLDALLEVMHYMMQEFPQSYIILDALDECTDRAELMSILEDIAKWKLDESHLLVTSRKERDIESSLESIVDPQNTICLQSEVVDGDIFRYVRQRLADDKSLSKWQKDPDIRHEIETTLMKGAHGMFRWAVCQLNTLGKCRNRLTLRQSLARLPPTLDETYERILCAIDKEDSEYAVRILRWLAFSSRPLLVEEIAEVVAIDVERNPAFNSEEVLEDPLDVLSICSSLVTITTAEENISTSSKDYSKVVILAHFSVKEYLISERIFQSKAAPYGIQDVACNEYIAKCCIGYLLHFQASGSLSHESILESALAPYAAKFWIKHTQAAARNAEALNRLIIEFFSTGNGAYLDWFRIHNPEIPWKKPNFNRTLAEVPPPLYYASLSGLTEIAGLLVFEAGADVNAQGGRCGYALSVASAGGYDEIVELLLSHGANVNMKRDNGYSALQQASIRDHVKTVELLLSHGADNNAQEDNYGSALQTASAFGRDKIVKILLNQNADVNAQGGFYGTALQAASTAGCEKAVEMLLNYGADVNTPGGHYGNALQAASAQGKDKTVKILLDQGADVNAPEGRYGNALQTAIIKGYDKVVEILLSYGADVNAQGSLYGTALQLASSEGRDKFVEILLSYDADVNAQGGPYGTALQAASAEGHDKVVEILLSHGANINAQEGFYGNALQVASLEGRDKTSKLLLDRGANVNAQGGHHGNPLQAASVNGHDKTVEILLSHGANVNAQGGHYGTALQAASFNGHDKTVEILLIRGADVNVQGGHHGNALQAASAEGHDKTVEMLLSHDANVNAQGGHYGTALQAALTKGHEKTVELLLNYGAEANTQGGVYGNALRAAGAHEKDR